MVSASADKRVKIWDTGTAQELATLEGHKDMVWTAVFSPDGKTLATGSADSTVKLWHAATTDKEARKIK